MHNIKRCVFCWLPLLLLFYTCTNNESSTNNDSNVNKNSANTQYHYVPLEIQHFDDGSFTSKSKEFKIEVNPQNNDDDSKEIIKVYQNNKLLFSYTRKVTDLYSSYPILFKPREDSSRVILMVNDAEYTAYFSVYYFYNNYFKYLGDGHAELIPKYQESHIDYKDFCSIVKSNGQIQISMPSSVIVDGNAQLKKNDSLYYYFDINKEVVALDEGSDEGLIKSNKLESIADILVEYNSKGYSILDSVSFDLNQDEVKDMLVVLKKSSEQEMTSIPFDYTKVKRLLMILKGEKGEKKASIIGASENVVKTINPNCSIDDAYQKLVTNKNYFTVEQAFCSSGDFVNEYITFMYDSKRDEIVLHKYGTIRTDQSDVDKQVPSKVYTSKEFGKVNFSDFNVYEFDPEKSSKQ